MQAIVNVSPRWGIGNGGALLVSISQDLKRFRQLTTDGTIIYGSRTLSTFPGGRPLKNRENLLLSHSAPAGEGLTVFRSVSQLRRYLTENGLGGRAWVVGGESIYRQLLPWCDRVEVTWTETEAEADAFFPVLQGSEGWTVTRAEPWQQDPVSGIAYQYRTYERGRPAVIFDLDGTLWNSTEQIYPAWRRVLAEYGKELTLPELIGYMGKTVRELGTLALPDLDSEVSTGVVDRCSQEELLDLRVTPGILYPGVRETLQQLAGKYRLMIVSNSQNGYVQTFLDALDLWDCFEDIEMYGRTGVCKGESIRLVLERNHIRRAVYVGDTQGDREAAELAGIDFLWAAYGFGKGLDAPRLDRFADLPGVLAALWPGQACQAEETVIK